MKNLKFLILIANIFIFSMVGQGANQKQDGFKYKEYFKRSFVSPDEEGRVIPIVTEKATELDGSLTLDGKYFVYSANREKSGFDLFVRYMAGVDVVKITSHASDDTSPALSHSGKQLAFVSRREDPEGDIWVMDINPEKIISSNKSNPDEVNNYDGDVKNISRDLYPNGVFKTVKDDNPVWSPDDKLIAFTSNRNGDDNIWLCDKNGENLRQLTKKGGAYPGFSSDGKEIIFISYRDVKKDLYGNIYSINLATGNIKKLTDSLHIKLSPTYLKNKDQIVYTKIDRDTNNNGRIDLKDKSVLQYKNISDDITYPITSYKSSSFRAKWFPVYIQNFLNTKRPNFEGVLVYSEEYGNNINLNMIPEYGIIPKRDSARKQYQLARRYLEKYDDREKYFMSLFQVYAYFSKKRDYLSEVYVAKALKESVVEYLKDNNRVEAEKHYRLLKSLTSDKNDYRNVLANHCEALLKGDKNNILVKAYDRLKANKKFKNALPFLMEDMADAYLLLNKNDLAKKYYSLILVNYKRYRRQNQVKFKLFKVSKIFEGDKISIPVMNVLKKGSDAERDYVLQSVTDSLIRLPYSRKKRIYDKLTKDYSLALLEIKSNKKLNKVKKRIESGIYYTLLSMLDYVMGVDYLEKNKIAQAKKTFESAFKYLKKIRSYKRKLFYYKINTSLAEIARLEKNYSREADYLYENARNYQLIWKQNNFREQLVQLINYYEDRGESYEAAGKYKQAAQLYNRYKTIVGYLHLKKGQFTEIYNNYALRAHILYVDALFNQNRKIATLKKLEKDYRKYLPRARGDYDKAYIYTLGYIDLKIANFLENSKNTSIEIEYIDEQEDSITLRTAPDFLNESINQCEWALFIDDSFSDPYLLKGWIYQLIDLKRREKGEKKYDKLFSNLLIEKTYNFYEKAIEINDEKKRPDVEANLNLNLGNSYFILRNYDFALEHYKKALVYKKVFSSKKEKAIFHYHMAYCYWQRGDIELATNEIKKVENVYNRMNMNPRSRIYRERFAGLYKYYALFARVSGNYKDALQWYKKLIDTRAVTIDRVRIYQEIALCNMELKNYNTALSYLSRADKLLKSGDGKDKVYGKSRWVLGPISWTSAPLVITGTNILYHPLNREDKELLNLSLKEEISLKRGDINQAIKDLQKKLRYLSDNDNPLSNSSRVISLNNIGYYYFKSSNYKKAEDYFLQAKNLAIEMGDTKGRLISIKNFSNLYAMVLENNDLSIENPENKVEKLIKEISTFKQSYEKEKIQAGMESLKAEADALETTVSEEDIASLKSRVRADAALTYKELDLIRATLNYYLLEIPFKGKLSGSMEYYQANSKNFKTYDEAINIFQNAMENSVDLPFDKKVVFQLNRIHCLLRVNRSLEARDLIDGLEKECLKKKMDLALWQIYALKADLNLSVKDYKTAIENYKKALFFLEKNIYLNSNYRGRVKQVYKNYSIALSDMGKAKESWEIISRGAKINSILTIYSSNILFASKEDNKLYLWLKELIEKKRNIKKAILTYTGIDDEVAKEKLKELEEEYKSNNRNLNNLQKETREDSPVLYSLLYNKKSSVKYKGAAFINIFLKGDKIYFWSNTEGKVSFKRLENNDDYKSLKSSIDSIKADKKFIIINKDLLAVADSLKVKNLRPITTLERGGYYLNSLRLKKNENLEKEKEAGRIIYADIDKQVNPMDIFGGKYNYEIIIKHYEKMNDSQLTLFAEAMYYSDISSLHITAPGTSLEDYSKSLLENSARDALFLAGKDYQPIESSKDRKDIKELYYKSIMKYMRLKDFKKVNNYLRKYTHSGATDLEKNLLYAELELAKGKPAKAITYSGKITRHSDYSLSLSIYSMLLNGDYEKAKEMLKKSSEISGKKKFKSSYDKRVYSDIVDLLEGKRFKPVSSRNKSIIPVSALNLLLARYSMLDDRSEAGNLLKDFKQENILSPYDNLAQMYVSDLTWSSIYLHGRATRMDSTYYDSITEMPESLRIYIFYNYLNTLWKSGNLSEIDELISKTNFSSFRTASVFNLDTILITKDINKILHTLGYTEQSRSITEYQLYSGGKKLGSYFKLRASLDHIKNLVKLKKNGSAYEELAKLEKDKASLEKYSLMESYHMVRGEILSSPQSSNPEFARGDIQKLKAHRELKWQYMGTLLGALNQRSQIIKKVRNAKEEFENDKEFLRALKSKNLKGEKVKIVFEIKEAYKKYEENIISALEIFDRAENVEFFNYRFDLLLKGIDFVIIYYMENGDYLNALKYSEVKKQLKFREKFQQDNKADMPEKIAQQFEKLSGRKDEGKFIDIIKSNPTIYLRKQLRTIPLASFQERLNDDDVVFYMDKNENHIIIWVITSDFIQPVLLRKTMPAVKALLKQQRENLLSLDNHTLITNGMNRIFRSIHKYYRQRKRVMFILDGQLEKIPFELMGKKNILADSHEIAFLHSISLSFVHSPEENKSTRVFVDKNSSTGHMLEMEGLKFSGIKKSEKISRASIVHLQKTLKYDIHSSRLKLNRYDLFLKGKSLVWVTNEDRTYKNQRLELTASDIAGYFMLKRVGAIMINGATLRDVNLAHFSEIFYKSLRNEKDIFNAYNRGLSKVIRLNYYNHPAYWLGLRLYTNGL